MRKYKNQVSQSKGLGTVLSPYKIWVRVSTSLCIILLICSITIGSQDYYLKQRSSTHSKKPKYEPDKVIFKITSLEQNKEKKHDLLKAVTSQYDLKKLKPIAPSLKKESLKKIKIATTPKNTDPLEFSKKLQSDPLIEWAEPVYYRPVQKNPNDPLPTNLTIGRINIRYAWNVTTGSNNITVAIIDTGVDYTHEDLQDNIWINLDEIEGDGIDNDNNGYIDDIRGWDFVDLDASFLFPGEDPGPPDNDPMDVAGHGTTVAGVVGAKGNNGIGTVGICWDVKLMALRAGYKYSDGKGYISTLSSTEALIYAADNDADIINLSYAGGYTSNVEREALDYCTEKGILIFAAAGNDGVHVPHYPAAYDNVISVAGLYSNRGNWLRHPSSNYGLWIDLSAPYTYYTTLIGGQYEVVSGTSYSSPIAAGLAALVKSAHPDWNAEQIRLQLSTTAMNVNDVTPIFDSLIGAGCIDAEAAVNDFVSSPKFRIVNLYPVEISGMQDGLLCPNEEIKLLPSIRNFSDYQEDISLHLISNDPYISIIDANCFIRGINGLQTKTSLNDPFIIQISPNTPSCHIAPVTVSVEKPQSGIISTDTLRLFLNPFFRNTQSISVTHPYTLLLLKLLNDEYAVAFDSYGFDYPDEIFVQLGSLTNGLSETVQISKRPQTNNAHHPRVVAEEGRIHLIYSGNIAPMDNQLFYSTMDPLTKQWTEPVQITSDADLWPYAVSKIHNIAVDSNGHPHVVWVDYRNEDPQFYHIHKDASGWSEEEIFDAPCNDLQYNQEPFLIFDSNNNGYLFLGFAEEDAIYMLKCINGIWSSPEIVVTIYGSAFFHVKKDYNDCFHLVYNGPESGNVSYIKYNGTEWSVPEIIMTDTKLINKPKIALTPDGNIYVLKEIRYTTMQYGTSYDAQFYQVVFDGNSWSQPKVVLFNPEGYYHLYYDFDVFEDGTNLFTYIPYKQNIIHMLNSIEDANVSSNRPDVIDNGLTTIENSSIEASWSSIHPSGISDNEYSIGTVPGGYDLRYWKSSGLSTSIMPDLAATPLEEEQQSFVSVRAKNGIDYISPTGSNDGITYFPADFVSDGIINYPDFAKFALRWLETNCDACDGFDLTDDGDITMEDMQIITEKWLRSLD